MLVKIGPGVYRSWWGYCLDSLEYAIWVEKQTGVRPTEAECLQELELILRGLGAHPETWQDWKPSKGFERDVIAEAMQRASRAAPDWRNR